MSMEQEIEEQIARLWCQHCKALQKTNETQVECWYSPFGDPPAYCASCEDAVTGLLALMSREPQAQISDLETENKILRELLWLHHGCEPWMLYGDDGEMQCSTTAHMPSIFIDFRRDSPELLRWKLASDEYRKLHRRPE